MSLAAQRAALVALIEGVPQAGRVHGYQRYAREDSAFRLHYLYTLPGGAKQLRGWQISRVGVAESLLGVGRGLNEHAWVIRGYMALDDAAATEVVFDELVEAIRTAFRADPTLGGLSTAEPIDEEEGLQLADAGPVMFCGVLCHSALLTLKTREYL